MGVYVNGVLTQTKIPNKLQWLDLRVFYVRISHFNITNTTPDFLTLNHVPLSQDTLLEVNCVRAGVYSDGVSTILKRDRLDKRTEEITFVNTDSIRMTSSGVKFEVFKDDVLVLSGTLELSSYCKNWKMKCCERGFWGGNRSPYESPAVEVYVAGWFSGRPIVMTQTVEIGRRRKTAALEAIPEYEMVEKKDDAYAPTTGYTDNTTQEEVYCYPYSGIENIESDGKLSWFNAGVRVGVGIGLSICLGVGIGVGLLVRTYHGTTRNFTRRIL